MQTHRDDDVMREAMSREFMDRLRGRAAQTASAGKSQITGGREGEQHLDEWECNGVRVRQLPDDEQGILRISIGGGDETPVVVNYCVFRGQKQKCIDLLRKALLALVKGEA